MVCDKAMRAAITRGAVEAARTALGIKLDPENGAKWLSFNERMERWKKRTLNEKPKTLRIEMANVKGDLSL
jgi:hypothetical protein